MSEQPNPIGLIRRLADALGQHQTMMVNGEWRWVGLEPSLVVEAQRFLESARVIEVPECAVRGLSDNIGKPYQSLFRTDSDDTERWREPVLNGDLGDIETRALAGCKPGPCTVHVVVVPGGER